MLITSMHRYLLSVNSHGVVTCALDFMTTLVDKLPLFSILYMRIMIDKLENISLEKVTYCILFHYYSWLAFQCSLDFSYPAQPDCSYKYCKVLNAIEDITSKTVLTFV